MLKKLIKNRIYSNLKFILLSIVISFSLLSCNYHNIHHDNSFRINSTNNDIYENQYYTSKNDVSLYIHIYKHLPYNYITKSEARELGWIPSKKNLNLVAPNKSIGGDIFGNYEKKLPVIKNRVYYECDIDYNGGSRNGKRIVFANDFDEDIGYIYYTEDHYNTFEKIY